MGRGTAGGGGGVIWLEVRVRSPLHQLRWSPSPTGVGEAVRYQIRTLSSGARYSLSPGFTSNALYQASWFLTEKVRNWLGEWTSLSTMRRSSASRNLTLLT